MKKMMCFLCAIVLVFSLACCTRKIPDVQVVDTPYTPVAVTLYFPDNEAMYLHKETRQISLSGKSLETAVLDELFKGPESEDLAPSLVGEDLVISVVTDENGLCTVDFTADFARLNSGGTARETFAISSIVNSLCEIGGIECVKINIEGDTNAEFGGHFTLDAPIYPNENIVAQ